MVAAVSALAVPAATAPWQRVPTDSLRLPETPGQFGYRLVDALRLQFERPSAIEFPRGNTNALVVSELAGRVVAVTNRMAPTRTVILDVTASTVIGPNEGLLSIALHPRFDVNGRLFLFRTASIPGAGDGRKYIQISEVILDPESFQPVGAETVLIRQVYQWLDHAGGDLEFGPEGHLYASIGDGFSPEVNSQQIVGDFFSAVLRLDVDARPGSLSPNPHPSVVGGYHVPADNPFVGATRFLGGPVSPEAVRTEFWSVGLREPFRISFDSFTGELWVADVGFFTAESVFITRPGANHGWPAFEGTAPGILRNSVPPDFPSNPEYGYVPPVFTYQQGGGRCVIGGVVYRGTRMPELWGSYLIADHQFGWVGAIRLNAEGAGEMRGLSLYLPSATDFATDPVDGEVWISELAQSRLWRLEPSPVFSGPPLPETLADTGAFSDLASLTPAPGVIPYEVNHPFWSDDAHKRRWVAIPDADQMLGFEEHEGWSAPAGTVWVKHFDLELTPGVAASSRRIETRFLVRQTNGVYGITYRWTSETNAVLVPAEGLDETIVRTINGVPVPQTWHYPSRSECLVCHVRGAGFALSFNTAQLNREVDWDGVRTHQIAALAAAGYLTNAPAALHPLPRHAGIADDEASLEWRARSYLAANCAFCHQPGGPGRGQFDLRAQTGTTATGVLNGGLLDDWGNPANRVIVPGDVTHSVLWRRLATRGPERMPPLASSIADAAGVALLESWIVAAGLPANPDPELRIESFVENGFLALRVLQPANRALQLEQSPDLWNGPWTPVDAPGIVPGFPARELPVDLRPEPGIGPTFYRVRTRAP